jgi:hypothetical protein
MVVGQFEAALLTGMLTVNGAHLVNEAGLGIWLLQAAGIAAIAVSIGICVWLIFFLQ